MMIEQTKLKKFSNKNLLVLSSGFPNEDNTYIGGIFVKNQLNYLKDYFNEITVISPVLFSFKMLDADKLCKNYNYDNIKVYFPMCYYIPIFYLSKILIDNRLVVIEKLIKNKNIEFDLIHAHFTWPSAYIGVKLKEKLNRPVIVTIHENSEWFDKEVNMNYPLLNYAWENADALIRVNKKDIPALKIFNKNVFSIPNGFCPEFKPLDKNECKSRLHLPLDKKSIFALGGLIERKGFNYLIDAMKIMADKRKDVLCFIGGSGPLKDKLQKQITDLNLQDRVKLIGFVPDELLPIWMNACDLFVLPSLRESFGVVQIEAMACGKPVVATYNSGSEEIITSEDYGLLCEPANPEELAEMILIALDKEWDNEEILRYAERFRWEDIVKEIIEVYRRAKRGV